VRRRGDVWTGEKSGDGERRGGGVRLGCSVTFSLGTVRRYSRVRVGVYVTSVVKAVFPLPLGPTSRNVGNCAAAAAFL
jgi:hypothetical protein